MTMSKPIGLGARDSLRLEAGLCLYGHDIDETTSPVEADLVWSMGKRRREEGGFPGADRIQKELRDGPERLRVGIKPDGKAPAREGTEIVDGDGGMRSERSPAAASARAQRSRRNGLCGSAHATPGTEVGTDGTRRRPVRHASSRLPFVPHRYYRRDLAREVKHEGEDAWLSTKYAESHEYIRLEARRRRRRHFQICPGASWATSCSSSCPRRAKVFSKGDEAAVVESVKAASEVLRPSSGEIAEGMVSWIQSGSRERGSGRKAWFLKIKLSDKGELDGLMDARTPTTSSWRNKADALSAAHRCRPQGDALVDRR